MSCSCCVLITSMNCGANDPQFDEHTCQIGGKKKQVPKFSPSFQPRGSILGWGGMPEIWVVCYLLSRRSNHFRFITIVPRRLFEKNDGNFPKVRPSTNLFHMLVYVAPCFSRGLYKFIYHPKRSTILSKKSVATAFLWEHLHDILGGMSRFHWGGHEAWFSGILPQKNWIKITVKFLKRSCNFTQIYQESQSTIFYKSDVHPATFPPGSSTFLRPRNVQPSENFKPDHLPSIIYQG